MERHEKYKTQKKNKQKIKKNMTKEARYQS